MSEKISSPLFLEPSEAAKDYLESVIAGYIENYLGMNEDAQLQFRLALREDIPAHNNTPIGFAAAVGLNVLEHARLVGNLSKQTDPEKN